MPYIQLRADVLHKHGQLFFLDTALVKVLVVAHLAVRCCEKEG